MLYLLYNTEHVDIIFNTLGVYNRLNIFQLFEQSINFITGRVVEKFKENNMTIKEMETILFDIINTFNPKQAEIIKKAYKEQHTTAAKKKEFYEVVKEDGIQINIQPFWHMKNIYDALNEIYDKYDWIQPYKTYFYEPESKRWCRMMNDQVIGELYIMKLKQDSKKQLSACSYAPVGRIGTPEKTDTAKKHKAPVSATPIKKGIQETFNTLISVDPKVYAKQHMFHRSSPIARRKVGYEILNNYGVGKPVEPELTEMMSARNVEVLNAYLLSMGLELTFDHDMMDLPQVVDEEYDKTQLRYHKLNGKHYLATPDTMLREYTRDKVRQRMDDYELGYIYIGEEGKFKEEVIDELADIIESEILDEGLEFFEKEEKKRW